MLLLVLASFLIGTISCAVPNTRLGHVIPPPEVGLRPYPLDPYTLTTNTVTGQSFRSPEETKRALDSLAQQQDKMAAFLKRIERGFSFSSKAGMEIQAKQPWAQKSLIRGTPEMPNFWTNRPDAIYVAEVVPEAIVMEDSDDENIAVFALGTLKDHAASADENRPPRSQLRPAKKTVVEPTTNKPKRTRTFGGDNRPKKKQRKTKSQTKDEKANTNGPRVTTRSRRLQKK